MRRQAADLDQFQPEGSDLREHALQRRLVRQRSRQHGVLSAGLGPESGERGPQRFAQVAAYADLVLRRLRSVVCAGHTVRLDAPRLIVQPPIGMIPELASRSREADTTAVQEKEILNSERPWLLSRLLTCDAARVQPPDRTMCAGDRAYDIDPALRA